MPARSMVNSSPSCPHRTGLKRVPLERSLGYIHAHAHDAITLSDIAAAACMSRYHFARLFRVSTGCSPMEYVRKVRVETAKALLGRSNAPLSSIAASLGFADQSHFTRTFRQFTGLPPVAYLKAAGSTAIPK